MAKCAYHPDRDSRSACSECQAPICGECEVPIAGKMACQRCVQKIRDKVAAEMSAVPQAPSPPWEQPPPEAAGRIPWQAAPPVNAAPAPPVYTEPAPSWQQPAPNAPIPQSSPAFTGTGSPIIYEPPGMGRFLGGILAGAAVSIICAIAWAKITPAINFQISIVNIFIGIGVGVVICSVSGRQGPVTGMVAAAVALAGMLLGWYLLYNDQYHKVFGPTAGWLTFDLYKEAMKDVSVISWICIAIGTFSAYGAGNGGKR